MQSLGKSQRMYNTFHRIHQAQARLHTASIQFGIAAGLLPASVNQASLCAASDPLTSDSMTILKMQGQMGSGPEPQSRAGNAGDTSQHTARTRPTQGHLVAAAMLHSPAPLIDIGVNLVDSSFAKDRHDVIERARAANVQAIIVTGTCVRTSKAAAALCDEFNGVYPLYFTAGVHPHNAKQCDGHTLAQLRALTAHPQCVAVGECGLDFNRNASPQPVQLEWFEKQVVLAEEVGKPLFLHARDAEAAFAEVLARHVGPSMPAAVVHCFTGSGDELEILLGLGLYVGITGWICDDRPERGAAALAALLPRVPRDRLMLETDAPYLTPRTIKPSKARPGRNEPALLPHVLQAAAAALRATQHEVALSTTQVACKVFGIQL